MYDKAFLADDPIDGTLSRPDGLDRQQFAGAVASLVERVRASCESTVLALIGSWGSGKSSILEIAKRELTQAGNERWTIVEFNPWGYADINAMLVGFFAEVVAALPKEARPAAVRERVGAFLKSISDVGKVGGILGVDFTSTIDRVAGAVEGDTSPTAKRNALVETLQRAEQPILMILDDLDRLSPSELLLVLKLVRFVGRLPNLYYLLAYDERTLLDVLAQTELCAGNSGRARDYLEKIVQIRIDVPPMREVQATKLLMAGVAGLLNRYDNTPGALAEDLERRFRAAHKAYFTNRLITPRAINRFLVQLDSAYGMLRGEVNFVDLACITFLRTFEPVVYTELYARKSELTSDELQEPGTADKEKESEIARWTPFLDRAGVGPIHAIMVIKLLSALFPISAGNSNFPIPPGNTIIGMSTLEERILLSAERRAIGHSYYFDRYFTFGVPAEDFSDVLVRQILTRHASNAGAENDTADLKKRLIDDTYRILPKLHSCRHAGMGVADEILDIYSTVFGQLSDSRVDGHTVNQRTLLLASAKVLFFDAPEQMPRRVQKMMLGGHAARLLLACRLLIEVRFSKTLRSEGLPEQLSGCIARLYEVQPDRDVFSLSDDEQKLLRAWLSLDPASCKRWLRQQVENGSWTAIDIVAWHLNKEARADFSPNDALNYRKGHSDQVEEVLGLDFASERTREADQMDLSSEPNYHLLLLSNDINELRLGAKLLLQLLRKP